MLAYVRVSEFTGDEYVRLPMNSVALGSCLVSLPFDAPLPLSRRLFGKILFIQLLRISQLTCNIIIFRMYSCIVQDIRINRLIWVKIILIDLRESSAFIKEVFVNQVLSNQLIPQAMGIFLCHKRNAQQSELPTMFWRVMMDLINL
jgi:hypothetical protein